MEARGTRRAASATPHAAQLPAQGVLQREPRAPPVPPMEAAQGAARTDAPAAAPRQLVQLDDVRPRLGPPRVARPALAARRAEQVEP